MGEVWGWDIHFICIVQVGPQTQLGTKVSKLTTLLQGQRLFVECLFLKLQSDAPEQCCGRQNV